uniref:UPF0548 protein At2g17695 n=1 Tax=Erigeron canadensis TaxID=72917 RepID=UPI001CB917C6|nr:UPF0548 protein At2g17695 [Erigeron canadensis]
MVFLSWTRPSPKQQKDCLNKAGTFNYDEKYIGATAKLQLSEDINKQQLEKDGFVINHSKMLVGSGPDAFSKGKTALQTWRHFGLSWAFVDPKTPIENGVKFCVCVKEFVPWLRMPLQVVYVNETKNNKTNIASFGFGGGTLRGHLLSGEERFSVEMDGDKQVWYEILSFSKPAHPLAIIGYPYVCLRQKYFAHKSTDAVRKFVSSD